MILIWHRPDEPGVVYVKATVDGISEYVMPEWTPVCWTTPSKTGAAASPAAYSCCQRDRCG